jgi:hypothetical protein
MLGGIGNWSQDLVDVYPFRCGSISLNAGDDEERISS